MPRAAEFAELREHQTGRPPARAGQDLPRSCPPSLQQKPGGSMNWNSPRRAFELRAANPALPHQAEFVFRHRPLQAEQQTVVDDLWIVRAFRIDRRASPPARTARSGDANPARCAPAARLRCNRRRRCRPSTPSPPAAQSRGVRPVPDPDRPRSSSITVTDPYPVARAALSPDHIAGAGFPDCRRPAPWSTAERRRLATRAEVVSP